jgi:biopolymer transport protein ExbB
MIELFIEKVWNVWLAGGWTMIPLAILSLLIYSQALRLLLYFSARQHRRLPRDTWRRWVSRPQEAEGEVGEIIRYTQDEVRSLGDIHNRFAEVVATKLPVIDRRLVFLNILITAAPLIGLLGTVLGMLVTFQSIALGGGKMSEMMSAGISQALFPPEVGLCVALPGLALVYLIKRKRAEYEAFLARLESVTVQHFRRNFVVAPVAIPARSEALAPVGAGLVPA